MDKALKEHVDKSSWELLQLDSPTLAAAIQNAINAIGISEALARRVDAYHQSGCSAEFIIGILESEALAEEAALFDEPQVDASQGELTIAGA
jgi:hypothetical protein